MKINERFSIAKFSNPSGERVFRVQGYKQSGERVRKNFPTEGEAEAERQRLELEAANQESEVQLRQTRLSQDKLQEAEVAFAKLNGKPLLEAVGFYLQNYREPLTPMTMGEAFDKFIADKKSKGKRPETIRNLEVRVGRLKDAMPGKLVSNILRQDVEAAIENGIKGERSLRTKSNERRALSAFFSWAVLKQYTPVNPVLAIDPPVVDRSSPSILTVGEARRLCDAAAAFKGGKLVPYTALGLFAGLRPTELARLTWDDIDIKRREIYITEQIAKTRQVRTVAMSLNLVEWIKPHAAARTPIKGENWQKDFDQIKEVAGYGTPTDEKPALKPWTQDLMRHTAITFHMARHNDEGKTATWAGNSPNVIHGHYRALLRNVKSKCREFWAIRPRDIPRDTENKIVKLKAA